jgi:ABC-type polysaccharide/polyol phosphate export permease
MGCLIILLILILATLLAGPIGFLLAVVLILGWAIITGSLRLLWNLLLLPFRILESLTGGRR